MQYNKQKAKEQSWEELNAKVKLEVAMATLHKNTYNVQRQREVNRYNGHLKEIESRKARGVVVRSRVKWQKVGDKYTAKFFKLVRQKIMQTVISELRDTQGRCFYKREDLKKICFDFYKNLYQYKEVSEDVLREISEGFLVTFKGTMNNAMSKEITVKKTFLSNPLNGKRAWA